MLTLDPWFGALIGSFATVIVGWLTYRHNERKRKSDVESTLRDDSVALRREALEGAEMALKIMQQTLTDAAARCEELIEELRAENEWLKSQR